MSTQCLNHLEDEEPFFLTPEERDLAEGVQCPLHGKRFTPQFHIFVAAWLWENEVKFRWPRLSAQYHKAWAASFPPDLWPAETIQAADKIMLRSKDGTLLEAE
jgi:hypothetical protein